MGRELAEHNPRSRPSSASIFGPLGLTRQQCFSRPRRSGGKTGKPGEVNRGLETQVPKRGPGAEPLVGVRGQSLTKRGSGVSPQKLNRF